MKWIMLVLLAVSPVAVNALEVGTDEFTREVGRSFCFGNCTAITAVDPDMSEGLGAGIMLISESALVRVTEIEVQLEEIEERESIAEDKRDMMEIEAEMTVLLEKPAEKPEARKETRFIISEPPQRERLARVITETGAVVGAADGLHPVGGRVSTDQRVYVQTPDDRAVPRDGRDLERLP